MDTVIELNMTTLSTVSYTGISKTLYINSYISVKTSTYDLQPVVRENKNSKKCGVHHLQDRNCMHRSTSIGFNVNINLICYHLFIYLFF